MRDVPLAVVDSFLRGFKNHPGSPTTESEPVLTYIRKRKHELSRWDVLFAGLMHKSRDSFTSDLLGFPLFCQRRAPGKRSKEGTLMVTNKQRVASRGVEKAGLTEAEVRTAEKMYDASEPSTKNYPDRIYRQERKKPLLIVHLLAIGREGSDQPKEGPVAAWSMSFPKTDKEDERVEYVVNKTWHREHFGDDDTDDDDEQ